MREGYFLKPLPIQAVKHGNHVSCRAYDSQWAFLPGWVGRQQQPEYEGVHSAHQSSRADNRARHRRGKGFCLCECCELRPSWKLRNWDVIPRFSNAPFP